MIVAAWLVFLATTLLALGGAARAPVGLVLGWPGWTAAAAATAAIAVLAKASDRAAAKPLLGLAPFPLLLLAGASHPAVRSWSGLALGPLVLAGLVWLVGGISAPAVRRLFLPLVALLYVAHAAQVQISVGPEGDEPHYLMVADSLIHDGDLALEQDYALGRYRAFLSGSLEPHYIVRGKHGEIFSVHAIGLSLLVLPAYAVAGYAGASFFLALLAAWLAFEIRELIRALTDDDTAHFAGWIVALCPPLIHYSGLVFTEIPAALIVAVTLRRGLEFDRLSPVRVIGLATALSFLPWLNVRYAPLAAILIVFLLAAGWRSVPATARLLLPPLVSAVSLTAYHWALYGFFDPRRIYGRRRSFSLAYLEDGLPGLVLDQEFGLLVYAPIYVLAVPGFADLLRRHRRLGLTALALTAFVYAMAGSWHMWRGGFNPPARFLVPIVPVLAIAAAQRLRLGLGAAAVLLCGWSLWTGLVGASDPPLVHRDRQGGAPLFREWSGALEWTRLLPAYVLAESDRHRLALVWGALLAIAVFARAKGATPRGLLAGSVMLLAAAGAAAALARPGGTAGRDAIRVLGRPALVQPGWRRQAAAVARWAPVDLDWGPFFEPHRRPTGAPLGELLSLPPGHYRLTVAADLLHETPPWIEIRPHPSRPRESPPPTRRALLSAEGSGSYSMVFDVEPGAARLDLVIGSEAPFELRSVELTAITP